LPRVLTPPEHANLVTSAFVTGFSHKLSDFVKALLGRV
jgi:hypothetical protein